MSIYKAFIINKTAKTHHRINKTKKTQNIQLSGNRFADSINLKSIYRDSYPIQTFPFYYSYPDQLI